MTAAGFGVALAVAAAIIEAFAQVVLKQGASVSARRSFWIAVAVALFAVELLFYTSALQFLEVSTAFPISGLSFAVVGLLSYWLLGERITAIRWTGIVLILIGTSLIAAQA